MTIKIFTKKEIYVLNQSQAPDCPTGLSRLSHEELGITHHHLMHAHPLNLPEGSMFCGYEPQHDSFPGPMAHYIQHDGKLYKITFRQVGPESSMAVSVVLPSGDWSLPTLLLTKGHLALRNNLSRIYQDKIDQTPAFDFSPAEKKFIQEHQTHWADHELERIAHIFRHITQTGELEASLETLSMPPHQILAWRKTWKTYQAELPKYSEEHLQAILIYLSDTWPMLIKACKTYADEKTYETILVEILKAPLNTHPYLSEEPTMFMEFLSNQPPAIQQAAQQFSKKLSLVSLGVLGSYHSDFKTPQFLASYLLIILQSLLAARAGLPPEALPEIPRIFKNSLKKMEQFHDATNASSEEDLFYFNLLTKNLDTNLDPTLTNPLSELTLEQLIKLRKIIKPTTDPSFDLMDMDCARIIYLLESWCTSSRSSFYEFDGHFSAQIEKRIKTQQAQAQEAVKTNFLNHSEPRSFERILTVKFIQKNLLTLLIEASDLFSLLIKLPETQSRASSETTIILSPIQARILLDSPFMQDRLDSMFNNSKELFTLFHCLDPEMIRELLKTNWLQKKLGKITQNKEKFQIFLNHLDSSAAIFLAAQPMVQHALLAHLNIQEDNAAWTLYHATLFLNIVTCFLSGRINPPERWEKAGSFDITKLKELLKMITRIQDYQKNPHKPFTPEERQFADVLAILKFSIKDPEPRKSVLLGDHLQDARDEIRVFIGLTTNEKTEQLIEFLESLTEDEMTAALMEPTTVSAFEELNETQGLDDIDDLCKVIRILGEKKGGIFLKAPCMQPILNRTITSLASLHKILRQFDQEVIQFIQDTEWFRSLTSPATPIADLRIFFSHLASEHLNECFAAGILNQVLLHIDINQDQEILAALSPENFEQTDLDTINRTRNMLKYYKPEIQHEQ